MDGESKRKELKYLKYIITLKIREFCAKFGTKLLVTSTALISDFLEGNNFLRKEA